MALKSSRWWSRARFGTRLTILVCAALCGMLGIEAAANWQSLATRGLTPVVLPMQNLVCDTDTAAVLDVSGLHVESAGDHTFDLISTVQGVALHSVTVTLKGSGVVNVAVLLEDEANAYSFKQVYSAYCVADDPSLSSCYAVAESAGNLQGLCVRVKPSGDDAFTVAMIALNAPVPFRWQPFRMGLSFCVGLALLCALFLRGWDAAYCPRKRLHRWIVALPVLGLMALSLTLAQWMLPGTPLFTGITDEEAAHSQSDAYAVLYETLRQGRLDVDREPSETLAGLNNPYDQSERLEKKVNFPFDYAYDQGRYYIYYGLTPALTVYAPFHALTGLVPTSRDATLLMGWLAIAMIAWAVCGLAKRYAPGANVFALSLCCVTAVFATGEMFLMVSADFYYLAELSFVCFGAGTLGFGLHAATQANRKLGRVQYALSGLCFVLSVMSRPSPTPMLVAFLTPLYLSEIRLRRARMGEALAFLVPALLGMGFVCWYNAARFGSIFDFGAANQLTVTDVHYRTVRLAELPQALYHYLLEPPGWGNRFPYLSVNFHTSPTVGRYVFALSNIGVLAFPITWGIALWASAFRRVPLGEPILRQERRWTLLLPLAVSLPLMLVSYGVAGAILRYTCDFRLFYVLAGIACALPLMTRPDTPERKTLAALCVALCVASLFVGFGLLFDNERDYILKHSPAIYYGLQRMLLPY